MITKKKCHKKKYVNIIISIIISIIRSLIKKKSIFRCYKTIVDQVDLTAKLCLSFCLELQTAKSTYQHVDLDLE